MGLISIRECEVESRGNVKRDGIEVRHIDVMTCRDDRNLGAASDDRVGSATHQAVGHSPREVPALIAHEPPRRYVLPIQQHTHRVTRAEHATVSRPAWEMADALASKVSMRGIRTASATLGATRCIVVAQIAMACAPNQPCRRALSPPRSA